MRLVFQILNQQMLIFCMNDQKFVANLDYVPLVFFCNIIIINDFYIVLLYCYIFFFLNTRSLLVQYVHVSIGVTSDLRIFFMTQLFRPFLFCFLHSCLSNSSMFLVSMRQNPNSSFINPITFLCFTLSNGLSNS